MSRERPILFSAPMVRAIQAGTKTQTRRLVTTATSRIPCPADTGALDWSRARPGGGGLHVPCVDEAPGFEGVPCTVRARIETGDMLWVRETWNDDWSDHVIYRADGGSARGAGYAGEPKWRPSIFMPRKHSRIFLRVTDVRVERLQDITTGDIIAEGVDVERPGVISAPTLYAREQWRSLWDSINEKRAPWRDNPWVWVVSFEVAP